MTAIADLRLSMLLLLCILHPASECSEPSRLEPIVGAPPHQDSPCCWRRRRSRWSADHVHGVRVLEIEDDAALVAVDGEEREALAGQELVAERPAKKEVAARRLDLLMTSAPAVGELITGREGTLTNGCVKSTDAKAGQRATQATQSLRVFPCSAPRTSRIAPRRSRARHGHSSMRRPEGSTARIASLCPGQRWCDGHGRSRGELETRTLKCPGRTRLNDTQHIVKRKIIIVEWNSAT